MKSNKEIRAVARQELSGYWTMPVLATLVYGLITSAINMPNLFGQIGTTSFKLMATSSNLLLAILVAMPLGYGFVLSFLKFLREDKEDTVSQMFCGFKTYGRSISVMILMGVKIFLWSLLLIIPGIIKAFAYAMSIYISNDCPELSANECLHRSEDLMRGHKWQLFVLGLSFIGWALLCVLTLGIGVLWLHPYMQVSTAVFYESLKADEEMRLKGDFSNETSAEFVAE